MIEWAKERNSMEHHLAEALKYIPKPKLCLQAGGAHGVYPLYLAKYFDEVITCEPHPDTWPILKLAVSDVPKITCLNVALWDKDDRGHMVEFRILKPLTAYVGPGDEFDCILIDSLGIKPDLIWLDVQGAEYLALLGAKVTLKTCQAVIIEDTRKGLEERVGVKPGSARKLLEESGFTDVLHECMDTLFVRLPDGDH